MVIGIIAALMLSLALPSTATANLTYDFLWEAVQETWTTVPSHRPDGEPELREIRHRTEETGRGVLRLSPLFTQGGTTFYDALLDDVTIALLGLGDRPSATPNCRQVNQFCRGQVTTEGSPARPSAIRLGLVDSDSPHCMFDCSALSLQGVGRVIGASEPVALGVVAVGLLAAAIARRRRR